MRCSLRDGAENEDCLLKDVFSCFLFFFFSLSMKVAQRRTVYRNVCVQSLSHFSKSPRILDLPPGSVANVDPVDRVVFRDLGERGVLSLSTSATPEQRNLHVYAATLRYRRRRICDRSSRARDSFETFDE